jgi:hypothetical protein
LLQSGISRPRHDETEKSLSHSIASQPTGPGSDLFILTRAVTYSEIRMRKRWRFAGVVVAAAHVACVAVAQQVLTESGAISGVRESGLSVYKGVPFAAPPVGDLRWRPPVHVAPWTGTRKSDAFAPACMQVGVSMPGETPPAVSEDCLYLNIWTPTKRVQERCR